MISFTCPGCGRPFSVRDEAAGRRASCRTCGATVVVPGEPRAQTLVPGDTLPKSQPIPAAPRIPLRLRRLISDQKQMAEAFADFPLIRICKSTGSPPDVYELEYAVKGLEPGKGNNPTPRETHRVEIRLTGEYPRVAPQCKMLTPIFHPNIDPTTICIGDHWTAGERLASLAVRIGELIAYQAYNIRSPLDAEAAMWADLNGDKLPIDSRNLHPAEM